jgi:hypothetical protein
MFCSIDGATQDSYEKYRRGGNLELIIKNLELILKIKKELKSTTPHIVWRFLVFKHNEHEIELAKHIAAKSLSENCILRYNNTSTSHHKTIHVIQR